MFIWDINSILFHSIFNSAARFWGASLSIKIQGLRRWSPSRDSVARAKNMAFVDIRCCPHNRLQQCKPVFYCSNPPSKCDYGFVNSVVVFRCTNRFADVAHFAPPIGTPIGTPFHDSLFLPLLLYCMYLWWKNWFNPDHCGPLRPNYLCTTGGL